MLTLTFLTWTGAMTPNCLHSLIDLRYPWSAGAWRRTAISSQKLRSSCSRESTESQSLDQQSVTSPWPVSCVETNFPREKENSETNEVFLRSKKSKSTLARHSREPKENHALVVVWITYMGHFFRVSFSQSSCFAWFRVHICFISGSSHVCGHLLAKMDSREEASA